MRLITIGNVTINADLACGVDFDALKAKVFFVSEDGRPCAQPVIVTLDVLDGEKPRSAREYWAPLMQSLGNDRDAKLSAFFEMEREHQAHKEAIWRAQDRFREMLFPSHG